MARPSLKGFFSNWATSDLPIAEKARLTLKNNLIKLRTGEPCCGNHGEPGC